MNPGAPLSPALFPRVAGGEGGDNDAPDGLMGRGELGPSHASGTDPLGAVAETDHRLLQLSPQDNVLVAVTSLAAGEDIIINGQPVTLATSVRLGHKIAARDLACGDKITKYGAPIGSATQAIPVGQHVHTHNMKSDYLPTYTWAGQKEFFQHPA